MTVIFLAFAMLMLRPWSLLAVIVGVCWLRARRYRTQLDRAAMAHQGPAEDAANLPSPMPAEGLAT